MATQTTIKVKGIIRHQSLLTATAAMKANGQRYDQKNYSVNVLIPKNEPMVPTINQAFETAITSVFGSPALPANAHTVWKDCAVSDAGNADLANYYELRLASREEYERPLVCDANHQPILDPATVKVGDEVWVVGVVTAYDTGDGGTSCYLNGTMITGVAGAIPIDKLSSRQTAEQMFGGMAAPVAAAPVAAAPVAAAPVAAAPVAAAPVAPQHIMTAAAQGATYEAMITAGWTDETLIAHGMMIQPSYA